MKRVGRVVWELKEGSLRVFFFAVDDKGGRGEQGACLGKTFRMCAESGFLCADLQASSGDEVFPRWLAAFARGDDVIEGERVSSFRGAKLAVRTGRAGGKQAKHVETVCEAQKVRVLG